MEEDKKHKNNIKLDIIVFAAVAVIFVFVNPFKKIAPPPVVPAEPVAENA